MLRKTLFLLSILTLLFSLAPSSYAQSQCDGLTGTDLSNCNGCANTPPLGSWVWTGIGCIKAGDPQQFIGTILGWAVVVGGGIAFVLIAFAGFQITTAAGDVKRVQAAQELLTSAIFGLLLVIFSIFLLNLIGIKILNLGAGGLNVFSPPNP